MGKNCVCFSLCFRVPQVQMEVLAVKGRRYDCFRTTSAHEIIVSAQLFGFFATGCRVQQNENTFVSCTRQPYTKCGEFFSLVSRQSQQTLLKHIGFSRTEGKLLPASISYPVRVTGAHWRFSKHQHVCIKHIIISIIINMYVDTLIGTRHSRVMGTTLLL